MNRRFTKLATGLMCIGIAAVMLPSAAAEILLSAGQSASVADSASDYTYRKVTYYDSEKLAALVYDIMQNGNCGLYTDTNGTKAAGNLTVNGGAINNSQVYYARTDSGVYSGWGYQCYIYAQGVAARIFDEIVGHGPADGVTFNHLTQVMGAAPSVTYSMMRDAQVMPGAYMRTTVNANGAYNSSYGHSLIILEYDEESITVLEGNAHGHGEIEVNTLSYDAFNSRFLTGQGRYVSHVMQPNDVYYRNTYGLSWSMYAAPVAVTTAVTTVTETTPDIAETTTYYDDEEPLSGMPDDEHPPITSTIPYIHSTEAAATTTTAEQLVIYPQNIALHRLEMPYQFTVPFGGQMIWLSSDPNILSVDDSGVVTPHSDGQAMIFAGNGTYTCRFYVTVESVEWESVGDLDSDGTVTAKDAMQTLQIAANTLAGYEPELSDAQFAIADVDDNGTITATDAQQVLRFFSRQTLMESSESAEEIWSSLLS